MSDGEDRDRPQMAGDDAYDCQALTGSDITKYRARVARIRYLSQDRPDLRFASMQVCWCATCDIGSDGKTPMQRLHGRKDNTPILEFGEKILYMPAKPARGGKWEPRFHPGVFVGMLNSSSEAVVATEQRMAIKTRSGNIRRIPESERWDTDKILKIRAVPLSPDGSDNAFDTQVGMERPAEMMARAPGDVLMENKVARTCLRRADFE